MGEEFHSLKTVRYPWLTSHLWSRSSWVLFPEPSMPSTMKSLPGMSPFSRTVQPSFLEHHRTPKGPLHPGGERLPAPGIEHRHLQDGGSTPGSDPNAVLPLLGSSVVHLVGHGQDRPAPTDHP